MRLQGDESLPGAPVPPCHSSLSPGFFNRFPKISFSRTDGCLPDFLQSAHIGPYVSKNFVYLHAPQRGQINVIAITQLLSH